MPSLNFIDLTSSSVTEARFQENSPAFAQSIRSSQVFRGIIQKCVKKSEKRPIFKKDIDSSFGAIDPSKLSSLFNQDSNGRLKDQRIAIKPKTTLINPTNLSKVITSHEVQSEIFAKSKVILNPNLSLESSDRKIKITIGNKKRQKSAPNSRMFESMRNSWYPDAPLGDIQLEEFDINTRRSSLNIYESRLSNTVQARRSSQVRVSLKPYSHLLNEQGVNNKNQSSVHLSIHLSFNNTHRSRLASGSGSRPEDIYNQQKGIDTNLDIEKLLMANEDFVEYLELRKNKRADHNRWIPKMKPDKSQAVRKKTFGSPVKKELIQLKKLK
jgi:hypothetical protein